MIFISVHSIYKVLGDNCGSKSCLNETKHSNLYEKDVVCCWSAGDEVWSSISLSHCIGLYICLVECKQDPLYVPLLGYQLLASSKFWSRNLT